MRRPVPRPEEKAVLNAHTEFSIEVAIHGAAVITRMEYFDGSRPLTTRPDNPCLAKIGGLPAGVRALIVVARLGQNRVVSKPVAVVVHPDQKEAQAPLSGKISMVLDGALFQDRILDGRPYVSAPLPLYLETAYAERHWDKVLGNAPSFSGGHHRCRAEYGLDLERVDSDRLVGTFVGASGAPFLMAIMDEIGGGGEKVWLGQLPELDGSSELTQPTRNRPIRPVFMRSPDDCDAGLTPSYNPQAVEISARGRTKPLRALAKDEAMQLWDQ